MPRGAGAIAGVTMRSTRERKLPARSKATSSVVPPNSPVKSAYHDGKKQGGGGKSGSSSWITSSISPVTSSMISQPARTSFFIEDETIE